MNGNSCPSGELTKGTITILSLLELDLGWRARARVGVIAAGVW
jgi:hypothetical protein